MRIRILDQVEVVFSEATSLFDYSAMQAMNQDQCRVQIQGETNPLQVLMLQEYEAF